MIDVGKVVDLVLLMIDGNFGFEMANVYPSTVTSEAPTGVVKAKRCIYAVLVICWLESIEKVVDVPIIEKGGDEEKRRRMSEKKKLVVHAPMRDLGGVSFDKDAVYVQGSFTRREGEEVEEGEGEKMVMDLQEAG
ncbi:hypothetical protein HHX47_DHR2000707 [Lentinula edodes]|nr:hypothetical protein HHX47_DHR2000707 [Lentinula edodes]